MADSLVLNTVGIKRPPKRRTKGQQSIDAASQRHQKTRTRARRAGASTHTTRRRVLSPTPIIADTDDARVTTIRLDDDLARKLDQTALAAGVSTTQLALATLEQALSISDRELRIDDQRRQRTSFRSNRKLRLPHHLQERADVIRAEAGGTRIARSQLINTAIRRGLPDNPRLALAIVLVAATATRASRS